MAYLLWIFIVLIFTNSILLRPLQAEYPRSFDAGRIDYSTGKIIDFGENVRWAVPIGSPTYATPVVAKGKVLIGTLNNQEYNSVRSRGRSVLLCFDEKTGEFLWQLPLPKDYGIPYFDSFCVGISSTPTIVDNRAYLTSGRGEIFCLDLNGLYDGNAGPYTDEAALYAYRGEEIVSLSNQDADVIWRYDMFRELLAKPHDTNNCHIIHEDGLLYVTTGNAPNYTHRVVEHPEAPSLIVLDANDGTLLAVDDFGVGNDISHGQWCSPMLATVEGVKYIYFGGGNGVLYAFESFEKNDLLQRVIDQNNKPITIKAAWKFQGDPRAQPRSSEKVPPYETKMGSASYTCLPPPAYSDNKVFMLFGYDGWNAARPFRTWLAALEARVSSTGLEDNITGMAKDHPVDRTTTALLWGTPNIEGGAITPMTIEDGLLYFADRHGNFYALDTITGQEVWKLPLRGDIWAKPLVVDEKIYVGTDHRMFYILQTGRIPQIIAQIKMPGPIFAPATAANNHLFIAGDGFLYCIGIAKHGINR